MFQSEQKKLPNTLLFKDMAEACGSRIYRLSESQGVTGNCATLKVPQNNARQHVLPTYCPRVFSCRPPLWQHHLYELGICFTQRCRNRLRVNVHRGPYVSVAQQLLLHFYVNVQGP